MSGSREAPKRSLLDSAQPVGKRKYRLVTRVHPRSRSTIAEVFGKAWPLFGVVLNLSDSYGVIVDSF
ncbi:hypothetical protein AV530_012179 [Patagioenas fasciata monilis]|uniref:Uncharacterized protein n=1 Tax=Patagioenas fasciata monilis TaxID=372326 RepID=A0A1V4KDV9_PATFA|nr:hypothetical protein AV530_012179 [Patagioenas fasciata monilis]